jgi:hypothetical protein
MLDAIRAAWAKQRRQSPDLPDWEALPIEMRLALIDLFGAGCAYARGRWL